MSHLRISDGPAIALAIVGLLAPLPAQAQRPSFGPLTFEEGAPLQRISYTPTMETADILPRGAWAVDSWLGFSNIFEQDSSATHLLFLDMERLITNVSVRWGVAESIEIATRVTLETTGGGKLDGVILGWHEALGFGQANRDRFPEGAYRQTLTNGAQDVYIDVAKRTLAVEDVRAAVKWRALRSEDGRSVLSLRAVARLPVGDDLDGKERGDVAAMALARLGMGAWYAHAMLGGSTIRKSPELESILRSGGAFLTVGLERSLGSRLSAIAQFQTQTAVLRSFEHREVDRAPTNLVLGFAGRLGGAWSWDVSFQEDIPADTPAIDFTLGVRISRSW